jgi:hypothetical protein
MDLKEQNLYRNKKLPKPFYIIAKLFIKFFS